MITYGVPTERPTAEQVHDLMSFLAANADVARADGMPEKVAIFQRHIETLKGLQDSAPDLSNVTRVVVVTNEGKALERWQAYDHGCGVVVQDEGQTLKVLPAPADGPRR